MHGSLRKRARHGSVIISGMCWIRWRMRNKTLPSPTRSINTFLLSYPAWDGHSFQYPDDGTIIPCHYGIRLVTQSFKGIPGMEIDYSLPEQNQCPSLPGFFLSVISPPVTSWTIGEFPVRKNCDSSDTLSGSGTPLRFIRSTQTPIRHLPNHPKGSI